MPKVHVAHRRFVLLLMLVLLLATTAACASPVPSRPPTASPRPTGTASGGHTFPELEARLPVNVGGQTLDTASAGADPSLQDAKTLEVLERLGKTAADLQLASASLDGVDVSIGALRIVGADARVAMVAFREVDEADPQHQSTYDEAIVSDKAVVTRTTGTRREYIYPLEDILIIVSGSQPLVEEAIAQLP